MRRLLVLLKNLLGIPKRALFTHISIFAILQDADIDATAAMSAGVRFYRGKVGRYTAIDRNSFIADTDIGSFTSIGNKCEIGGAAHPLSWVSTSSVFHKWENTMRKNFSKHEFEIFHRTVIGNDVWIGANCMVKAGVTISDGAVVGMGSVVTKDIGPYEIWAGNPAKMIRKRFDEDTIGKLLSVAWWDWDDEKIGQHADKMTNVSDFLGEIE